MKSEPTWRKPAGMGFILLLIAVWAVIVASLANHIGDLHWSLQAMFYAAAGIVWIVPLKPLLRWMESGRWRA